MPWAINAFCTAVARRSPNARLYSVEPRSSQWPSIVTRALRSLFSSDALYLMASMNSGLISYLSKSKNTTFNTMPDDVVTVALGVAACAWGWAAWAEGWAAGVPLG